MVRLYASDGRLVKDELVRFDQNNIVYDMGDIPSGVYLIRFFDMEDNNILVEKIQKMN